jgi:hypothetical protein
MLPFKTLIYSSYNAVKEKPKYRVYILIRDPAFYIYLAEGIIDRFPDGGFDISKCYPENILYLPARNPHTGFGFFHVSPYPNLFDVRSFIPDYLAHKQAKEAAKAEEAARAKEFAQAFQLSSCLDPVRRQMRIDKALALWQSEAPNDTLRHKAFFKLTIGLLRAGLSDEEVALILEQQAHYSSNPEGRKRQIADTISNAHKWLMT